MPQFHFLPWGSLELGLYHVLVAITYQHVRLLRALKLLLVIFMLGRICRGWWRRFTANGYLTDSDKHSGLVG